MKLKKILAVALAATTALSSGVAYDMLGASASKAEAAENGFYSVGDTFTVEQNGYKYTYTVTKPILNGAPVAQNSTSPVFGTNGTYTNAVLDTTYDLGVTTGNDLKLAGLVKLSSIEVPSGTGTVNVPIPMSIVGNGKTNGDVALGTGGIINTTAAVSADATTGRKVVTDNNSGIFYVDEIELNGDSITNADRVASFTVTSGNSSNVKTLKVENFSKLNSVTGADGTTAFVNAKTIDVSNTDFTLANAKALYAGNTAKLETLDISDLNATTNANRPVDFDFTTDGKTATSVDLSGNATVRDIIYKKAGGTLNISDCTGIGNFTVIGASTDGYDDVSDQKKNGIKFITDDGDGSYDLDLSFVSAAKNVTVKNTGIRSFTAPTMALVSSGSATNVASYGLDVSNNALDTVNLSGASNAVEVNVSNNKLMDVDVSGLSSTTTLNVSSNYLTSLDVSSVNSGKSFGLVADKNFISTGDNGTFVRSDDQKSVNVTNQRTADAFKWAYIGDIAQASGSTSKALMKLGGTGTLVGGIVVVGAPNGFAKKLADTIKWTEGNSSESSAITLGESSVVQADELAYNLAWRGQGNLAAVVVSTGITANATKTAAEKVTLQYGNAKQDINVSNDNIVIVDYDITGGIPADNAEAIKASNNYTVSFANLMFPREGFILNSAGTVDATMSSTIPLNEVAQTKALAANVRANGSEDKFGDLLEEKLKVMEGLTFSKWNTAADGSGTAVSKNSKLKAISEDTTVYAQYTENTYTINYTKDSDNPTSVTVTGSTAAQTGVKFGESVTLNSNGFTTTKGNYYGWSSDWDQTLDPVMGAYSDKFYTDGQSVQGVVAKSKKSDTFKLYALYGDADHYISTDVTSIDLTVGDSKDGAYKLDDLKTKVTGDPTKGLKDSQVGIDLGLDGHVEYLTSDSDVVKITTNGYALAQGKGTANIYVRDFLYGNIATVSVTVQSKDEAAAAAELKAKQAATNKAIAAGEKTDVSDYSKFAAQVVKNADGENTVTVTKGKNVKTAKINTITIGDKTYTVTRIGANAYKGMSKLTTVTTSNKVKVIGKAAFANCKKLTKVTLGKAVVKIAANAFKNDKKLAKILIKSKKLTKKARVGKNSFKGIKATAKFYIAKKAATYKKVKKAIKAQSGAPKKATYVKKYA